MPPATLAGNLRNMSQEQPASPTSPVDVVTRTKTWADAITSVLGAVTGSATLLGLIWVVLEAFFLPDGLPRLDAASFATLASAIAVAAVIIILYCSAAVGAGGIVFRRWRSKSSEQSISPFTQDTKLETAQFFTITLTTALVVLLGTSLPQLSPFVTLGIPTVTTFLAVLVTALIDSGLRSSWFSVLRIAYASLLSSAVWFISVSIFVLLAAGSVRVRVSGIPALDIAVYLGFVAAAGCTNYVAAVAKPGIVAGLVFAITVVGGIVHPQMLLGAPFRALQLIDTVIHFPAPMAASDKRTLERLTNHCDRKVLVRLPDGSYEVFVRQRLGLDWTVNCDRNGGTVTFARTIVDGTMPVVSPTPLPMTTARPGS
jgi:hypothetical protein